MEQTKLIQHSGDEILSEEDCHDIINELEQVAHLWYEIGLALGLTPNSLDRLKALAIGENDSIKLLTSMIVEWLRMRYNTARFGKPTWKRIVEAVRANTGGRNPALADKLAKNYGVTTQVSQPARVMSRTFPPKEAMPTSPEVPSDTCCCCCFSSGSSSSHSQVSNLTETVSQERQVKYTREVSIPRKTSGRKRKDSCSKESSGTSVGNSLEYSRAIILAPPTREIEEITQHEGYCGAMTGKEAEENLRSFGGNCYLLRYSKRQEKYVITVLFPDAEPAITDYTISITISDSHRVYEIEGTKKEFPSIAELLEFYQTNHLTRSKRTIGKVYNKPSVRARAS